MLTEDYQDVIKFVNKDRWNLKER